MDRIAETALPLTGRSLIEAANRRKRFRRLVLAGVLAGVVALAVSLAFASRSPGHGTFRAAGGRWVPAGVSEIDITRPVLSVTALSAPPIAARVTDPSEIKRILAWFNALDQSSNQITCFVAPLHTLVTFRAASGATLATADVPSACEPIRFTTRGPAVSLADRNAPNSFSERVARLVGPKSYRHG
jgi:hypothetical protein